MGGGKLNLFERLIGLVYTNPYPREDVLFGNFYGVSNAWFFMAIFWACCILSVCLHYLRREETALTILLCLGTGAFVARKIQLPFEISAGLTAVAYMYVGKIMARYHVMDRIANIRTWILVSAVVVFLLLSNAGRVAMNISYLGFGVFGLLCSLIGSVSVLHLCKHYGIRGGWIGRNTLYIFVAHSLIQCIEIAMNIEFAFTGFAIADFFLNAIIDISGALLLGYLLQYTHILEYKKVFQKHEQ